MSGIFRREIAKDETSDDENIENDWNGNGETKNDDSDGIRGLSESSPWRMETLGEKGDNGLCGTGW
ncbi:hypothetical protein GQ43DRAFT_472173 [Delitschia confertaspora ATCC 74209]|uniref:Uncharacterized protein n=1 Tax=Delitschia confertaspora ATCC 74209 TaxID=1513339 RepID=A0A9P4JMI0_9PLEO|nr:hypothetical protein GQ43DRAFT_472173 [Delitschia confertaspora ATCC 74209]